MLQLYNISQDLRVEGCWSLVETHCPGSYCVCTWECRVWDDCNLRSCLLLSLLSGYSVPWLLLPSLGFRRVWWLCAAWKGIFLSPRKCGHWGFQLECVPWYWEPTLVPPLPFYQVAGCPATSTQVPFSCWLSSHRRWEAGSASVTFCSLKQRFPENPSTMLAREAGWQSSRSLQSANLIPRSVTDSQL